jgi:5S rRNA maturation endonuclease (ribonuclease M5)
MSKYHTTENLRAYITLLEEAGGSGFKRTSKGYLGRAVHRPDRNPSLGVFIGYGGRIIVHDFAWKRAWGAESYLRYALGREDLAQRWREMTEEWDPTKVRVESRRSEAELPLPKAEVKYMEVTPATDEWEATARAKMEEALRAIEDGEHPETLNYMESRGLKPEYAYAAGLGALKEGIAIPVYDEDIRMKNVKVRRHDESRGGRFFYVFSDRGNGYYFSPDFAWRPMERVIIVEGETNAAAVYDALGVPTIGVPGASTGLSRKLAERLKEFARSVVVMTDLDDPGRQLKDRIIEQLYNVGYDISRIRIPREDRFHRDPMDILRDMGLDGLANSLKERIYNQGADVKRGRGSSTAVAKAAARKKSGLNTKRALANATGEEIVRRHAKFIEEEELEAVSTIEDYLTGEALKKGIGNVAIVRKAVRRWMVMSGITGRTALFILYEANGIKTGSREFEGKFSYQRQHHRLIKRYHIRDEKMTVVGFDIAKLLEDAVAAIVEMLGEVACFFKKLAERIKEERDAFAAWIKDAPRLLGYIVRKKVKAVAASPPAAVAA